MYPVIGERLAGGCLRLRNLIFMVGKNKVLPAAVNVKSAAKRLC